jgi:solute carrier family 35 protein F5
MSFDESVNSSLNVDDDEVDIGLDINNVQIDQYADSTQFINNNFSSSTSSTSSPSDSERTKSNYFLGICVLMCVVLLWVGSSNLIQQILQNQDSPFFLTFLSTGIFLVYLFSYAVRYCFYHGSKRYSKYTRIVNVLDKASDKPTYSSFTFADSDVASIDVVHASEYQSSIVREGSVSCKITSQSQSQPQSQPQSYADGMDVSKSTSRATSFPSSVSTSIETNAACATSNTTDDEQLQSDHAAMDDEGCITCRIEDHSFATVISTAKLASIMCPLWFLMNYLFNLSLTMTTVASGTILSSTSSLFVLIISVCIFKEPFSYWNLAGIIVCIAGAAIVSLRDELGNGSTPSSSSNPSNPSNASSWNAVIGDLICLLSAVFYAIYTALLKVKLPEGSKIDLQLLFGFIGLFNIVFLWPFFFILDYFNVEKFVLPDANTFLWLFVNGFLGSALSDFLWAKSVVLTSPLIATMSMTLTIPLAMIVDNVFNGVTFSPVYFVGSSLVLCGFVLVNWNFSSSL